MVDVLEHPDGQAVISGTGPTRVVEIKPGRDDLFVSRSSCPTSYPTDLINAILRVKGLGWLCDEIARDEDPAYVAKHLLTDLDAYFEPAEFDGKRILDFGSGSGASTAILGRNFPSATFVGVELNEEYLDIARRRAAHHGLQNVEFIASPGPESLPDGIGDFDLVILSAVVEHLLPHERTTMLPLLWEHLGPGGALFLDQTPYRWFPIDLHTTMLPLINYMPDSMALNLARRWSKRVENDATWGSLQRAGIRGATAGEIATLLLRAGPVERLRYRRGSAITSDVDLWFSKTDLSRGAAAKRVARGFLIALERVTGVAMVPDLTLAFRKPVKAA